MSTTKNQRGQIETTADSITLEVGSGQATTLVSGGSADRTLNFPDASGNIAGYDIPQTWTAAQTWSAVQTFGQTNLRIQSADTGKLILKPNDVTMSADRTFNLQVNNADRTVNLSGDLVLGGSLTTTGAWTQTGAHSLNIITTGNSTVTMPLSGTLSTVGGSEILVNKQLTNPTITENGSLDTAAAGTLTIGPANMSSLIIQANTEFNGSIGIPDNNSTNHLLLNWNEDETVDRTLNFFLGGDNRTLNLQGDLTVLQQNITFDQTGGGSATAVIPWSGSDTVVGLGQNNTFTGTNNFTGTLQKSGNTIDLGGNLTTANSFTTLGNFSLSLTQTGNTNLTLPTTGTLATLAGTEELQAKTLTDIGYSAISLPIVANAITSPAQTIIEISSGSIFRFLNGGSTGDIKILINRTGGDVTIQHLAGANGFYTGTGGDLVIKDDDGITVIKDNTGYWQVLSGAGNSVDVVKLAETQTLENKTLRAFKYDSVDLSIAANSVAKNSASIMRLTGGSSPLNTVTGGVDGDVKILVNERGSDLVITNDSGSNGIITGTGADLTLKDDSSVTVIYDGGESRWKLIGGAGSGGGLEIVTVSGTFTASKNKHYLVDSSGGAFTIDLPAGSTGAVIRFSDASRTWDTNNVTLDGNASETIQGNTTLELDVEGTWVQIMWDGSQWILDTAFVPSSLSLSGDLSVDGDATIVGDLTVDTDTLYVDSTNNRIGISTTSTTGLLTLNGAGKSISTGTIANGGMVFGDISANVPAIVSKTTDANNNGLHVIALSNDTNSDPDMVFSVREQDNTDFATTSTRAFDFRRFATSLMTIERNGNVGIGTTDPQTKFHVYDTSTLQPYFQSTSTVELNMRSGSTNTCGIRLDSGSTRRWLIQNDGSNGNRLDFIPSEPSSTSVMTIHQNGYVGIRGNPSYRLDVSENGTGQVGQFYNTNGSGSGCLRLRLAMDNDSSVTVDYAACYQGSGAVVGSLRNNNGSFSAVDLSDQRVKTDIRDADDDFLNILSSIPVRRFRKNFGNAPDICGFIAQEVQPHVPEAVSKIDPNDEDEYFMLAQANLIPYIWGILRKQQELIESLQEQLNNG